MLEKRVCEQSPAVAERLTPEAEQRVKTVYQALINAERAYELTNPPIREMPRAVAANAINNTYNDAPLTPDELITAEGQEVPLMSGVEYHDLLRQHAKDLAESRADYFGLAS